MNRFHVDEMVVKIGEHNYIQHGEEKLPLHYVAVKAIHTHPDYKNEIFDNNEYWYRHYNFDITILELEREIDLTKYTPACLPKPSDIYSFDGKSARSVGWIFRPTNVVPKVLSEVDLTVLPHTDRRCDFENHTLLPPSMMCSGLDQHDTGACKVSYDFLFLIIKIFTFLRGLFLG